MVTPVPPHGRLPDGVSAILIWAVKYYVLGISRPRDITILAELIGDLKTATEETGLLARARFVVFRY